MDLKLKELLLRAKRRYGVPDLEEAAMSPEDRFLRLEHRVGALETLAARFSSETQSLKLAYQQGNNTLRKIVEATEKVQEKLRGILNPKETPGLELHLLPCPSCGKLDKLSVVVEETGAFIKCLRCQGEGEEE